MWQTLCYYGALALESVLGVFGVRLYEEPHYDVIDRVAVRVEIRRYAHRLAAEVQLAVAGEAGRNEAFRLLFAYIAGANRASGLGNRKIAMTVPVEVRDKELVAMTVPVQTSETNGTTLMRFSCRRNTATTVRLNRRTPGYGLSQPRTRRSRSCVFPVRAAISQSDRTN